MSILSFARSATRARFSATAAIRSSAASVHTLPKLDYAYDALEPHISGEIMTLHHTKHHQTYVNGLNAVEDAYVKTDSTKDRIKLQAALKFNGGGVFKRLYILHLHDSPLKVAIERYFGSLGKLKDKMNTTTAAIQGSGWGWLGYKIRSSVRLRRLTLYPILYTSTAHVPIVGIDIWEHTFYLQYKNVKPDYLNAIWNVVNFKEAEARLVEASN
ncbi:hypothetical protein EUX98_g6013 [Antrodiella citrinella]|uniref:Superoxide dismutase n=1 Tax=Antrodiella citrinella TaxID=2447956 RepID=A0A4S4MSM8_9APHY|nr:hypothetical protein EUX98_g6013 [Antrodiella citrinella]